MLRSAALKANQNIFDQASFCLGWHAAALDYRTPASRRCFVWPGHTIIGFEIDLHMFQAALEALDKHIVHPASFAIHADLDVMVFECIREILASKLATLVTVKDIRCAVDCQGFFQRLNTKGGIQTVGQTPREHLSRAPVHDCNQIQKTLAHRNVRQVFAPHLTDSVNLQILQ